MSDCFDHAMDAWESQCNYDYVDAHGGDGYGGSPPDPLFYFLETPYECIVEEREKAVNLKMCNSAYIWVPKSLCREWDKENRRVYIHKEFIVKKMKEVYDQRKSKGFKPRR